MTKRFAVTITRQFGSMGRPIAMKTAELLGIEFYDRDIVEAAAKHLNLPLSLLTREEESAKSKLFNMRFPLGPGTTSVQDDIFIAQQKIINQFVEKKSCVIVGRCSDYILKNMKNCIHIHIYAPYEARLNNCVELLDMTIGDAKKSIQEVDKARDAYHKHYTGYLPNDIRYKNLLIDSSMLGVDKTAEYLAQLIGSKFELNIEEKQ